MYTKTIRLFCLTVLAGSLVISQGVVAGGVVLVAPEYRASLVKVIAPKGFVTQLNSIDDGTPAEQLHELRSLLISRKQVLASELDENRFDTDDVVLTVVMPGGLLYAAYKKAAYERVRHDLEVVSENIADCSRGLALLQEETKAVVVAQLSDAE